MTSDIVSSFQVSEFEGLLVVDSRLIADRLGIQHESFIKTIRKHQDKIQQRFGHLRFEVGEIHGRGQPEIYVLLTEEQVEYLESISRPRSNKPNQLTEYSVVTQLRKEIGGQREVLTPAGNIDLLTPTEVIEVKRITAWREAIGQVFVYSAYYPSHKKRIHFFGSCHGDSLKLIEKHCKSLDIKVTYHSGPVSTEDLPYSIGSRFNLNIGE